MYTQTDRRVGGGGRLFLGKTSKTDQTKSNLTEGDEGPP